MRLKTLLLVLSIIILVGIGVLLSLSPQKEFYLGSWEAELLPTQKNIANIQSLIYTFEENSFLETSDYVTEGMKVNSSGISYFKITNSNQNSFSGVIYKKEHKNLNFSFIEPECKDSFECQRRELLKSTIEETIKKNLEISDNENLYKFTLTRINGNQISLESSFCKQILHKK